jgi:hypothetical protein
MIDDKDKDHLFFLLESQIKINLMILRTQIAESRFALSTNEQESIYFIKRKLEID